MQLPKLNLCAADRIVRGTISIGLIVFSILWYEQVGDVFLLALIWIFAALNLISFAIGWCPVYHLAGITTCKPNKK